MSRTPGYAGGSRQAQRQGWLLANLWPNIPPRAHVNPVGPHDEAVPPVTVMRGLELETEPGRPNESGRKRFLIRALPIALDEDGRHATRILVGLAIGIGRCHSLKDLTGREDLIVSFDSGMTEPELRKQAASQ